MHSNVDAGLPDLREGRRQPVNRASRPRALALGLAGGIVTAVLGTALHAHILRLGAVDLPAGALAALLLAGSIQVWCGLRLRSILVSALSGGTAYVLVALISMSRETLILTGTDRGPDLPSAAAGNIWIFGLAVVTLIGVGVCAALLGTGRRR